MKLTWSRAALSDLAEARAFIAPDDPAAAARLGRRILGAAGLIEQNPRLGKEGEVRGTRELVVAGTPYRIIYRIKRGRLEILRVWHGKRLWPREA